MPIYCYKTEDNKIHSVQMTVAEMEMRQDATGTIVLDDGTKATRSFAAEHGRVKSTAGNWPQKSYALGVHPDQVLDAMKQADSLGVPTEFTKDGDVVFRDRAHRRKYMKATGHFDLDGGYSDAQKRSQ